VPGSFRFLTWNVSDSEWVKHGDESRAVLSYADPDVVMIIEIAPAMNATDVRRMLSGLRGPGDTTWFISFRAGTSGEHEAIASRDSVVDVPEFAFVPYPDTGALVEKAGLPELRQQGLVLNVKTNGALVRRDGGWMFVVAVHLPSDGGPTSPNEYRRQLAAIAVRERAQSVLEHRIPSAVIAAGDFNLIAGSAALDTLLKTIVTPPLGPMRRADAYHWDGRTDWTWDGRGTSIGSQRFDNVLYSTGTLVEQQGRVWDTELLSPDTLAAHGLTAGTSRDINRHRPIVVDFTFRR